MVRTISRQVLQLLSHQMISTQAHGAATHILHSYLDPDSSLTRFPTPNTNVSVVNKRQLGVLLLTMLCVFMVASINRAMLPQIKRYNTYFFFF